MRILVYKSFNFTYLSQPLAFQNENAGIEDLKFHLLKPPQVLDNKTAGIKELKFHLFKPACGV